MQQECRYICQRAANAIISEVGSFRVSTDALHGINQFLDEFLVRLLTHAQSLDLSRIKASVFHLLPSTLGKNAIVEAELEVKTFTETEVIDYDVYEKMRSLGSPSFPLDQCLPLLRDKCFEFCTLADKDDQQSWLPQQQQSSIVISPIVAIYVTTVLEHMAEYILTAVAMTAETEDTDYVRIKELFLALVDDMQVGLVFQSMDLRDKMAKRSFPHGYVSRSSMLPPTATTAPHYDHPRNSSNSMNPGNNFLGDIVFDDLELNYDDDEDPTVQQQRPSGTHTSLSNYSVVSNGNRQRPLSMMTNSTSQTSFSGSSNNKKAYKVFKNDHTSPLATSEPAAYDPDSPTMNFEDLIRSGNTMRVSLTPHRLKSIEVKDQMADEPTPSKPAWKRRSSSVPRMSTSSNSSRPQTPTMPHHQHHRSPSPLVTSDSVLSDYAVTQRGMSPPPLKSKTSTDNRFEQPREAPKPPLPTTTKNSSSKSTEKSLPTPTSSTSSRQSKHRAPVPTEMKVSSLSESTSTTTGSTITSMSDDTSKKTPASTAEKTKSTPNTNITATPTPTSTTTTAKSTPTAAATPRPPTLRRGSLSNRKSRENLRRQREKEAKESSKTDSAISPPTKHHDSSASPSSNKQQQKGARPSKSTSDLTEQHQSSSDSLDSLDSDSTKKDPSTVNTTASATPQRPSSYVAKRASMAGASRRQSLHESYAITVTEPSTSTMTTATTSKDATPTPRSHPAATAGTVGNAIKQLDQVVKKSSSSSIQSYSRKASTTSLASDTTTTTDSTLPVPPKSASRKSAVLDRVLQFERAYSLDDTTTQQRRASSYIPRRERFMYLQRDPNALEKKPSSSSTSSGASSSTSAMIRPGTSAAIAAAAARFASGVSMAIQTDPAPATSPSLTVTDDAGNHSPLPHGTKDKSSKQGNNDDDDLVSEHGVVDGDEEWFLPEDEWEDVHEQENAVAEWLLGEA